MYPSTTSEAEPPHEDGPVSWVFDHKVFRRRGVEHLNGMPPSPAV